MHSAIQSRDNEQVKYARRLASSAAFRAGEGVFFAEGRRLCLALAGRLPPQAVFATREALNACPALGGLGGECFVVSGPVAEKLGATKTPQGVFALFPCPRHTLADVEVGAGVLLCEALQDPANVGAVIRSAAGLGLGGVLLSPGCADPYGPKALRAGMGAAAYIKVAANVPLALAAAHFKDAGATIYAAAPQGAVALEGVPVQTPFALLVGNEGAGLSEEALALADMRVCIPMYNGMESLNAAAAAAVLMYHFKAGGGMGG